MASEGKKSFKASSGAVSRSQSTWHGWDCWPCARTVPQDEDVTFLPAAGLLPGADSPYHNSLRRRAFKPLTAGGIRQSTFTLVQTALGGGVLSMAYMVNLSGVGLGALLLALAALVAFMSMDILMKSAVELQIFTFSGLMMTCLGPSSGILLDFVLLFFGNGVVVAFLIMLGDFWPDILYQFNDGPPTFCAPEDLRTYCMVACALFAIPLTLPKNISALRHVSPFALAGLFYTVAVVVWEAPALLRAHMGHAPFGQIEWFKLDHNIPRSFSICIFAYNCHMNVVPVAQELVNPTTGRVGKTCFRVVTIQLAIYLLIAVGGYLAFLAVTPQNLLVGYERQDKAMLVSRALYSAVLMACLPMNAHPTVRSVLQLLSEVFPGLREPVQHLGEPLLESPKDASPAKAAAPWLYPMNREGLRHLISVLMVMMDCYIALHFRQVAVVIGILGASVGTMMMMVVPAMLLLVAVPNLYSPARRWFSVAVLTAASLTTIPSIFS